MKFVANFIIQIQLIMEEKQAITKIINKLPSQFQDEGGFLDHFLKAFEDVLTGNPGSKNGTNANSRASLKSISYILDNMDSYFDAYTAPPQFLEWLASWVGYDLKKGEEYNDKADVIENEYESPTGQHLPLTKERISYNRIFISKMVSIYQKRGTFEGIKEFIEFFIDNMTYTLESKNGIQLTIKDIVSVRFDQYLKPFVLRENSRLGRHTILGEPRPYYFRIIIIIDHDNQDLINKVVDDIERILEEEKPAYVYYFVEVQTQNGQGT